MEADAPVTAVSLETAVETKSVTEMGGESVGVTV